MWDTGDEECRKYNVSCEEHVGSKLAKNMGWKCKCFREEG